MQQGYKQPQLLLGTIRNRDDTGNHTKVSLEYEEQKSGYIVPLLSRKAPPTYPKWSPPTWIGSIKNSYTQYTHKYTHMTDGSQRSRDNKKNQ